MDDEAFEAFSENGLLMDLTQLQETSLLDCIKRSGEPFYRRNQILKIIPSK